MPAAKNAPSVKPAAAKRTTSRTVTNKFVVEFPTTEETSGTHKLKEAGEKADHTVGTLYVRKGSKLGKAIAASKGKKTLRITAELV